MKLTKEQDAIFDNFNKIHKKMVEAKIQIETVKKSIRDILASLCSKNIKLPCLNCKEVSLLDEWQENCSDCLNCGWHLLVECPECGSERFVSKDIIYLLEEEQ